MTKFEPLATITSRVQRRHILEVLEALGYDMKYAAKALQVSQATLYRKMADLDIPTKSNLFPLKAHDYMDVEMPEPPKLVYERMPGAKPEKPEKPLPLDVITERHIKEGAEFIARSGGRRITLIEVDWANREVDFNDGCLLRKLPFKDLADHFRNLVPSDYFGNPFAPQ